MKLNDVRDKFLKFYKKQGHVIIPSAPLIPENDPTTLFTGSGMQPLVPYLLGQKHPNGQRLTDSQKSFRAEDIDEVGDNRHTTFFEMLGNWSLGDYFKAEQLPWVFEFLTKEIGLSKDRIWVTCFEGDEKLGLPKDNDSFEIWQKLGMPKERISFYPAKKNWWSRSGEPKNMPAGEPGGPDSEIFFDFDPSGKMHTAKFGEKCHPNCDCGRFMEIGNSVFMEYQKQADGSFKKLAQRNVDFGGGLERVTAASNDNPDIFKIDVFAEIISELERISGKKYDDLEFQNSFRIIADHLRASVFLISDGVIPSKNDAGYFVRRLIRRSIFHGGRLGLESNFMNKVALKLVLFYGKDFFNGADSLIIKQIEKEESDSRVVIAKAVLELKKLMNEKSSGQRITTAELFFLYQTHGLQKEFIKEMTTQWNDMVGDSFKHSIGLNLDFNLSEFEKLMRKHQEISRAGAEKKFKGGLGDTSEMSVKYHTATHLLHQALRDVLGNHVSQKGSNITPERLRFDFTHPQKMTEEEKKKVEAIVNEKIQAKLAVHRVEMPKAEAEKSGAFHFFGDKYGDIVSVHYIGESLEKAHSKEFCGGPHVKNTSELGHFKIQKEEAISAGVRRIKAVLD